MISGWDRIYQEILRDFGYDHTADIAAARALGRTIQSHTPLQRLRDVIGGRSVFVIGAGPSLHRAITPLRRFDEIPRIVADGALAYLMENGIAADVVVTDLDGDLDSLKRARGEKTILVVHAHGDNIEKLAFVRHFADCVGTAQAGEKGEIHNFGGFTDGDRAVILAESFGAKRIILLGMDMGKRIGRYSFTARRDRAVKLKKLQKAGDILEWLAPRSKALIYTTSGSLRGIRRIRYGDIQGVLSDRPVGHPLDM